jgi:hypothetical protein
MNIPMQKLARLAAAIAVAGAVAGGTVAANAQMGPRDTMRPGQMHPGQMRPGQMQRGQVNPMMMRRMMRRMMRGMMRRGRMGMGIGTMMGRRLTTRKLDASEVKRIIDGRLAWRGNKRLKVGTVTEKDDNTVIAEVVTVDGSLVAKFAVDRTTGRMRYVE